MILTVVGVSLPLDALDTLEYRVLEHRGLSAMYREGGSVPLTGHWTSHIEAKLR